MKKITFVPTNEKAQLLVPRPQPAKKYVPEWYKNIPGYNHKTIKIDDHGFPMGNVKNCIPFLDTLISGYIQETWTDIHIGLKGDDINYHFASNTGPQPMLHRGSDVSLPIGDDYYEIEFVWNQVWIPKLPKGYSYLFTHPLNRTDLPFTTVSAIVDSDKLQYSSDGRVPFYIKKNFSGIIPVGTPMYQMIPFKRDKWKSYFEDFDKDKVAKGIHFLRQRFLGSYREYLWTRKEYD
jgi:hypothetical protein